MIKGIVFDIDGVLFNTEPLHVKAWHRIGERYGFHFADGFLNQWIGRPCAELAAVIQEQKNPGLSSKQLLSEKEEIFVQLLESEDYLVSGVAENLKLLNRKFPLTWATTSSRASVEIMLHRAGIMDFFTNGICFEDVEKKKPDPEPYLKAAGILGIEPELCAGVDDSPSGTLSAQRAGLFTLGICSFFKEKDLPAAAIHFTSSREAMQWLLLSYYSG